ncbi:hypothetical protein [Aeromicrobium sp. Leaf291]|uniref:hypothetical protein n=1 Tax=Aeromicrobium sp. Leaf291 TaxID=1736325 RepID=UPI0006FE7432|nr:hypothetical protein [Aeromicrobium sp. Leaf291]KQP81562.1 hypothetical protein ASF35_16155 [Aeromicrobium sp. Leaf291]
MNTQRASRTRVALRWLGYTAAVLTVAALALGTMTLFERSAVSREERGELRSGLDASRETTEQQDVAISLLQQQLEDIGEIPIVPVSPSETAPTVPLLVAPGAQPSESRLQRAIEDYCASGGCGEDGADGATPSLAQLSGIAAQAVAAYCAPRNSCTPPAPPAGKDGATGGQGPQGVGLRRLACVDGELVAFLTNDTSSTVEGGSAACSPPPVLPGTDPDPEPTPDPSATPAS